MRVTDSEVPRPVVSVGSGGTRDSRTPDLTIAVTIVIVSFRCRALLYDCLLSLEGDGVTTYGTVIVVDNDSGDGTDAMVRDRFPWVDFRPAGGNLGFSKGNNLALAGISTEFVLLLNPDTVVPRSSLQECLEELRRRPDVGVLGCKLVRQDGTLDHACKRSFPGIIDSALYFTGLDGLAFRFGRTTSYTSRHLGDDEAGEVDAVNGAFMLVRRSAMDVVGLLDERFWMYMEDLDWCLRFWEHGWKVYYWPDAEVVHIKGATDGGTRRWKTNHAFHEAMWIFYDKHYAGRHSAAVNRTVRLGIFAKLLVSAAGGVRRNATWGRRRHRR